MPLQWNPSVKITFLAFLRLFFCRAKLIIMIMMMMMIIIIIIVIIIIIILTDSYKAPFLLRAHSVLQIYTTSTIHNAEATMASNHV